MEGGDGCGFEHRAKGMGEVDFKKKKKKIASEDDEELHIIVVASSSSFDVPFFSLSSSRLFSPAPLLETGDRHALSEGTKLLRTAPRSWAGRWSQGRAVDAAAAADDAPASDRSSVESTSASPPSCGVLIEQHR